MESIEKFIQIMKQYKSGHGHKLWDASALHAKYYKKVEWWMELLEQSRWASTNLTQAAFNYLQNLPIMSQYEHKNENIFCLLSSFVHSSASVVKLQSVTFIPAAAAAAAKHWQSQSSDEELTLSLCECSLSAGWPQRMTTAIIIMSNSGTSFSKTSIKGISINHQVDGH